MKGFAAAIILFSLCFNWFGYSTVVFFMQQKADVQLEASLDTKSIKESELFEIKIPLHLPYQTNWANYERYDEYENAKSDFYRNTNDLSSKNNPQKTPSIVFKKMVIESDHFLFNTNIRHWATFMDRNYFSLATASACDAHLISPKQPPDGTLA